MTRKDYVLIAEAIKGSKPQGMGTSVDIQNEVIQDVALSVAKTLQRDNARFDVNRFMLACGFEVEQ